MWSHFLILQYHKINIFLFSGLDADAFFAGKGKQPYCAQRVESENEIRAIVKAEKQVLEFVLLCDT